NISFQCEQPEDIAYGWHCEENEEGEVLGYVLGGTMLSGEGDVHLCMGAWDDAGVEVRARAIVHELSHRLLGTWDHTYFGKSECHETENSATVTERENNADSLACLVYAITEMSAEEVANRAGLYRGNLFEISQFPEGHVNLEDGSGASFSVSTPPRRDGNAVIRDIPSSSAFGFRWVLVDSSQNRYPVEDAYSHESVTEYGDSTTVMFSDETLALLRQRNVTRAMLYCRIRLPANGSKLTWKQVHFSL
ncbi:MAG: hypothetical protein PVG50_08520, partial [Thiohalophilus sp.]